jgi:pyrroloquinoline-quinone synthase
MSKSQTVRDSAAFLAALDAAIEKHHMLRHPFYKAWSDGCLDLGILGEYSKQYFAHVAAFPTYVSAVHSRCPDIAVRQVLLRNLTEEESGADNHPELWTRFAESLGVARESVTSAALLPETAQSVADFRAVVESADFRSGVAGLYAYESQIPSVSKTKRDGLKQFYGIDDPRAVSFFTVHEQADVFHSQETREILANTCTTAEAQEAAIEAGARAAKALWKFLDGVQAAYLDSGACRHSESA